jgi:probable rRNA maturation factor
MRPLHPPAEMAAKSPEIEVLVNNVGSWPAPEHQLAGGCRAVLDAEGIRDGEISITLLDDEGILGLNQEYFGRDRPTDVLAFALHAPGEPVLGDVYLGFEQAQRQASEFEVLLDEELLRLVIHGTLHVLGYQHPEGEDRFDSEMFLKQEDLLRSVLETGTG